MKISILEANKLVSFNSIYPNTPFYNPGLPVSKIMLKIDENEYINLETQDNYKIEKDKSEFKQFIQLEFVNIEVRKS